MVDLRACVGRAVEHLAGEGFVAYPTETVWGLGACADRSLAIERLTTWKRRSIDAPFAVLVVSAEASSELGCEIEGWARSLMETYWPGPLTIITPCRERFAPGVARSDGALGLRCSSHPLAAALCLAVREAGLGPLTSTSLNRAGEPAAVDFDAAEAAMRDDGPDDPEAPRLLFAKGHDAGASEPSSVVDCTGARPKILRVGAIDRESLEKIWTQ